MVGIREKLNENRPMAVGSAVAIAIVGVLLIVYEVHSVYSLPRPKVETSAYFSDDDGATYFADSISRIPPFDHDGKQAVSAEVFSCQNGQQLFIGFLRRFRGPKQGQPVAPAVFPDETKAEVSLPLKGERGWMPVSSAAAVKIIDVRCPDGSADDPKPVQP
jgi:hypothetical protein